MNDLSHRFLPPAEPLGPSRGHGLRSGPFGVLDIGTTKIVCIIGRVESDRTLRVLGFGWQKGRCVRAGGITDLEEAERAIRAAVGQAEDMADTRLRAVTVNLSCGQPESRLFNVQWPVGGRAVSEQDIRRVVLEGRSRAYVEGREVVHALPLNFAVDDTTGVSDPRGLHCETLTARLHVIDTSETALRNLSASIARADLDIAELVVAPLATALAVLVPDERELGATVIDMGGGTTSLAVFGEGQLLHTMQLPVGGMHVTNDLARLLSTTVVHAERLKTLYGNVQGSPMTSGKCFRCRLSAKTSTTSPKFRARWWSTLSARGLRRLSSWSKSSWKAPGLRALPARESCLPAAPRSLPACGSWPPASWAAMCASANPWACAACPMPQRDRHLPPLPAF